MHLFEQDFTRVVNEADAAKIDEEFGTRRGGIELAPALFQRCHAGPGEAAFDAEEEFPSFGFGSDSKHKYLGSRIQMGKGGAKEGVNPFTINMIVFYNLYHAEGGSGR